MKPDKEPAFTVVSTFSGCGGSSLGYTQAGGKVLLAVEFDPHAAETYRLNFPNTELFEGDIQTLTVREVLKRTGLVKGELDVLDGSPPCQGFSMSGKRDFHDNRNQLFREFVRLLRGLKPKAFIMENVSGLVKGNMRLHFVTILQELKRSGYRVQVRLLNAMYYGVPQSRQRLIFIGVRSDVVTDKGIALESVFPNGCNQLTTCTEALEGLTIDQTEREWLLDVGSRYIAYEHWHLIPAGKNRQDIGFKGGFNCSKAHPSRPCPTITKNDSHVTSHGLVHWTERRRFTVAEFKRFATFPDGFQFAKGRSMRQDYASAVARIGNSVPPEFMRRIAAHVAKTVLLA